MAPKDLRDFLALMENKGDLLRIEDEVDIHLEMTEIGQQTTRQGGPALLFESPRGHTTPVGLNLFGSKERMASALGVEDLEEIADRLRGYLKPPSGAGLGEALGILGKIAHAKRFFPKTIRKAPCQEVVLEGENATLDILPIPTMWPGDAAPFVCFTQVITKDPETGTRNVGAYRLQKFDDKTLGMHWQLHKDGKRHQEGAKKRGERMEVAVALGGPPAAMYAATAPLPPGIDEYLFAGFLQDSPLEMVKAKSVDLEVPARAEYIIEGWVDPEETRIEGPFGDHTGYYSHPGPYPVLHLTAITHRKNPIYPHILVGKPLQEDWFLGYATERFFLPLIQLLVPEIVDWHFPPEGVFHNALLVSINKEYAGQARKVIHAIWGIGMLSMTKLVVVVDGDIDVQNPSEAVFHALANTDAARDLIVDTGAIDVLDHSTPVEGFGGKVGVDATRGMEGENLVRPWPGQVDMDPKVTERLQPLLKKLGLIS
ncbi:menaquinone biosynthesis decarboxylase [bacterium]|nr:menaquinone biosynthesis decarboxylase [bacterium]